MRRLALPIGALLYGIGIAFVRGEPRWNGDQGVFLSIAARVLDGDRLYTDVIDNKDPLFFYAHAAALRVGGWKGPAALDALWFGLAALAIALLLRELGAPRPAVLVGFFVYPLALAASWYEPGLSMLGGLALAPLAGWLWARGRPATSGAAVGVVALFKITVAPLAVAPLAALFVLGHPVGGRLRHATRALVGLVAALSTGLAVLAVRGELVRYLDVLWFNVSYPDAARQVQGGSGGVASHLAVLRAFFVSSGRWQWPLALAAVGSLALIAVLLWRRGGEGFRRLAAVAVAATLAALTTLALTAIWTHHLQMLALPAVLIAAVLVLAAVIVRGERAGVVVACLLVAFALWGAVKQEKAAGHDLGAAWTGSRSSVGADLLETVRRDRYPTREHLPYVVFGSNSENAHAVFISDAFDLACRWFHLYPNNAQEHLEETLECARRERPDVALVTVGFFEPRGDVPEWDSFVSGVGRLLDTEYVKVAEQDMFQVWTRREA